MWVQFCANDPDTLLDAARRVEPYCDYVDINLGYVIFCLLLTQNENFMDVVITSSVPKYKIIFPNLIRLRVLVKLVVNT